MLLDAPLCTTGLNNVTTVPVAISDVTVVGDDVRSWAQVNGQCQVAVVDLQRHKIIGESATQLLAGVDCVAQIGQESVAGKRPEEQREPVGCCFARQTLQKKFIQFQISFLTWLIQKNK